MSKRIHFRSLYLLAVWGIVSVGCEEKAGINVGGIQCELKIEHDVGPVIVDPDDSEQRVEHVFRFANPSSDHAMQLEAEMKSCGCIDAKISESHVPPGGEAVVKIGFQPVNAVEHKTETVVVKTGLAEEGPG